MLETRITRIAPAADAPGRVFSVEAQLPNTDGTLRPGSVISVRVPEATSASAPASVPLSAIVRSTHHQGGESPRITGAPAPGSDPAPKVTLAAAGMFACRCYTK